MKIDILSPDFLYAQLSATNNLSFSFALENA